MMLYTQFVKVKRTEWFDPVAGVCLFLGIFTAAYTLEITFWTYDLDRATAVALFSVLFGMLIGYSNFPRKRQRFLLALYALAIILWQFIFALDDDPLWMNRLFTYIYRVNNTSYQLINSIPLDDGILFLTGVTLLFCFAGLSAGFLLMHNGNPWLPYSVFAISAVLIQFYLPDPARNYILLSAFLIFSILLFGRLAYVKRRIYWKKQKIKEDREVSFSLVKAVALFALLLSFLSIGLPLIVRELRSDLESERSISQTATTTWDLITNFFFPLRQPEGFGEGGFNSILPLGTSRSLNEDWIFTVEIPDHYAQLDTRMYWYGRIYATFDGSYWQSTDLTYENLQYTKINIEKISSAQVHPFLFSYNAPSDIVFRLQETSYIGRPTQISYYQADGEFLDIQTILDPGYIHSGERVIVEGRINQHSLDDLQQASEDYPQWVENRYLQLPEMMSADIESLAVGIAGDSNAVIDKVLSITNYLRSNYIYGDSVDIPRGMDPIEWFLFDGQTGFCNYFASAEVLMLRTLGIPSRLVVGYAQGEPIDEEQTLEIKVKDSHAWVEVYFPEYGWVIFEPTPSQPRIAFEEDGTERDIEIITTVPTQDEDLQESDGSQDFQSDNTGNMPEDIELTSQINTRLRMILIWISVAVLGLVILIALIRGVLFQVEKNELPIRIRTRLKARKLKIPYWLDNWADYEGLGPVQKMFSKLKRYSGWILPENGKAETPREFMRRLALKVGLEDEKFNVFMDQFHQEVYGNGQPFDWRKSEKIYRHVLKGIVLKVWKDFKQRIRTILPGRPGKP